MAEREEDLSMHRFKSGSVEAYKIIFDQYYKPLCSFAKKYVLDLAVAEDIIQDLFVRFWEQRNEFQLRTSAKSYLFQAARNECLNYLKHQSVKEKYRQHIANVSADSFFHDKLEEEEINQMVYEVIRSLPPRCRQIFELSRFEGKTFDEIAQELSISKNTIKNQLVSALRQIRQSLEKNGIFILAAIFLRRL
ncbi:MAG: RNA polymerase sigma-70 factor [Mangrovibacterium sp.]